MAGDPSTAAAMEGTVTDLCGAWAWAGAFNFRVGFSFGAGSVLQVLLVMSPTLQAQ